MGQLTTIYDAFAALVVAALPTYKQLPNGYDLANQNQLYLRKGVGVTLRNGRGIELQRGSKRGRERLMSVVLTNAVAHTEHDKTGAAAADKALVEDAMAVETAVEQNNSLSGSVAKVDYVDDTGVVLLESNAGLAKYLTITVNFLVVYEETLP